MDSPPLFIMILSAIGFLIVGFNIGSLVKAAPSEEEMVRRLVEARVKRKIEALTKDEVEAEIEATAGRIVR